MLEARANYRDALVAFLEQHKEKLDEQLANAACTLTRCACWIQKIRKCRRFSTTLRH
ncbi:hypothetical protein ACLB1Q_31060 [Escherichia coli]